MALVCDDQILVSSYGENSIRSFSIEGDTTWTCILPHPRAMVRGPSEHSSILYTACYGDPIGMVACVSLQDGHVLWTVQCPRPRGITIVGPHLVVTEVMTGRLALYSCSGDRLGVTCEFADTLNKPRGISYIDSLDELVVAESGGHVVTCLSNPATRTATRVSTSPHMVTSPNDVEYVHGSGRIVAVTEWYACRVVLVDVIRMELTGAVQMGGPLVGNLAMITHFDGMLLVADNATGKIHVLRLL